MSGYQLELFKTQIENHGKKQGRRFSTQMKNLALSMYFRNSNLYRFLYKFLILPSPRSVRNYMNAINIHVGWNEKVFMLLRNKSKFQSKQQKVCAIVFDGMSIKSGLTYSSKYDTIEGYEDLAQYGRSTKYAQQAIVFMIKGISTFFIGGI